MAKEGVDGGKVLPEVDRAMLYFHCLVFFFSLVFSFFFVLFFLLHTFT